MQFHPVIGMEVHVETKTQSKMFCSCQNDLGLETRPNLNICPICTAHPGTLPVPNKEALVKLTRFGKALNCHISDYTWFERKSYFYPDLPKGYQITQYQRPLCYDGTLDIPVEYDKQVGITRIHMEEDTGKLHHVAGTSKSYVDYNRAGIPLMELVTEPDIRSGEEARLFCEELQLILRYLDISDAHMEKGQMRCEVNISLQEEGSDVFGTKVEIKNLNSFRAVENAIAYEIQRQSYLLDDGEKIVQETRGWDDAKGETFSQRKKENADDYRYFLEPDIPPFETEELQQRASDGMTELPANKRKRFAYEYGLDPEKSYTLVKDKFLAFYYEAVISELREWIRSKHPEVGDIETSDYGKKLTKLALNYLLTELKPREYQAQGTFARPRITPENYAEFITIVGDGVVSSSGAQQVLEIMFETGGDPQDIVEEQGLTQVSDSTALDGVIQTIVDNHPDVVEKIQNGKKQSIKFLVGQVMKETKGSANPEVAQGMLEERILGKED